MIRYRLATKKKLFLSDIVDYLKLIDELEMKINLNRTLHYQKAMKCISNIIYENDLSVLIQSSFIDLSLDKHLIKVVVTNLINYLEGKEPKKIFSIVTDRIYILDNSLSLDNGTSYTCTPPKTFTFDDIYLLKSELDIAFNYVEKNNKHLAEVNQRLVRENTELKKQLENLSEKGEYKILLANDTERAKLKEQTGATSQSDTVAELKGIAKVNYDKEKAQSFARIVAKFLWGMDTSQQIKSGDMANQIYALLVEFDHEATPETVGRIKDWLAEIAPTYAKQSGRPPKDQPTEIPLTLKK